METPLYKHSYKVEDHQLTSLSVYNTGLQRCESGYAWGPGMRDHFLIHYVMSGKGTYRVQGKTYALAEGDMFYAWPHELIEYRADAEDPWSYCWVGFAGMDAGPLLSQTDFSEATPVMHAADGTAPRALLLDIYELRGAKPYALCRMTGRLYAFLAFLMEGAKQEMHRRSRAGREHVDRACAFIAGNFASPITITDIASNVGACRSLLNRAFRQYLGMSPMQYLTKYRMDQACAMLRRTNMPVKAVAYSVGYEDPLYFSRRFKEMVGVSPREYAERLQGNAK